MEYAWGLAAASRPFPGDFAADIPPPSLSPHPPSSSQPIQASPISSSLYYCSCHRGVGRGQGRGQGQVQEQVQEGSQSTGATATASASATAPAPPAAPPPAPPSAGADTSNRAAPPAGPLLHSNLTTSTDPHSSRSTSVCTSCHKPLAEPGLSTFPPPFPGQTPRDWDASLHHRHRLRLQQQRRQSHPEYTRSVPELVVPRPGDPLPPARDHLSRPNLRLGRNRLSAPLTTSTAAFNRDRHRYLRHHHATMVVSDSNFMAQTASTATSLSGRTMMSTNELASVSRDGETSSTKSQQTGPKKPFVTKSNGRTYLSDPTLPYPLPVDLQELHRQSLRTLLLFQLFGGPVCSPVMINRPPTRVLDLCCGYGFWSMMCHSYFSRKGYSNIHFTGLDVAPLGGIAGVPNPGNAAPPTVAKDRGPVSSASGNWAEQPPDKNMHWDFVQHNMYNIPFPFADEEFDLVMVKEATLAAKTTMFLVLIDEFLRILKPGGVLEVWDCDHPIRMLRPHMPDIPTPTHTPKNPFDTEQPSSSTNGGGGGGGETSTTGGTGSKKGDHEKEISELGAYVLGNNTPLSGPQNNYLIEYNSWLLKYLESQELLPWPCANLGSYFLQEPLLTNYGFKRLAIPLGEVRWEREGVGGVVTKDGKSYIDTGKAIGRAPREKTPSNESADSEKKGRFLSAAQLALRQTALQTVLGFIEGLEPTLREMSGKKQDEWDAWMGKLMKELVEKDGANCGECLEVGAWWACKVPNPS